MFDRIPEVLVYWLIYEFAKLFRTRIVTFHDDLINAASNLSKPSFAIDSGTVNVNRRCPGFAAWNNEPGA